MNTAKSTDKIYLLSLSVGIITVVLGLALAATHFIPPDQRDKLRVIIAFILILGGIAQALYSYTFTSIGHMFKTEAIVWNSLRSVISVFVGFVILLHPLDSFITFPLLIAVFFIVEGALTIGIANNIRPQKVFIYPLINGVVSLTFAILIFYVMAGMHEHFTIKLLGLTFVIRGVVVILMAFSLRDMINKLLAERSAPPEDSTPEEPAPEVKA